MVRFVIKVKFRYIVFFLLTVVSCGSGDVNNSEINNDNEKISLMSQLENISGVVQVESIPSPEGFIKAFKVMFEQPVNHHNDVEGSFHQQVILYIRNTNAPNLLELSGYGLTDSVSEISELWQTNQINVEHRYFGEGIDVWQNLSTLTLAQAAADSHQILSKLSPILGKRWISSGNSKGGIAALAHHYFYPDDVEGTVAYVTPLLSGLFDSRISQFAAQYGSDDCRQTLVDFQENVLLNKGKMAEYIIDLFSRNNLSFSLLSAPKIIEYATYEYPIQFWQWGDGDCSKIPDASSSPEAVFEHLRRTVPIHLYSAQYFPDLQTYYIQAAKELGEYPFVTEHLSHLISEDTNPSFIRLLPNSHDISYDGSTIADIKFWAESEAKNLIYIYGEQDPWTAAAVDLSHNFESLSFVVPGQNHGVALSHLNSQAMAQVSQHVEIWIKE